jgi:hypothetical protein
MTHPDMFGPYMLLSANIELAVTDRGRAAIYGLGRILQNDGFHLLFVGRADDDLAGQLRRHIGEYGAFVYGYRNSPRDAFQSECELYHSLTPDDNTTHPAPPPESGWRCPSCRALG